MGKLKPQAALNPGFTGQRLDSVGPGDYDPKLLQKTKLGSNFGKGTERRVGERPSSNPGPGYYNHRSSFESMGDDAQDDGNFYMKMAQAHKKSLSSFVSTSQRVPIEGKVDPHEPGPMSYNIPRTGVAIKKKDVRIQCFDSTVTRFNDVSTCCQAPLFFSFLSVCRDLLLHWSHRSCCVICFVILAHSKIPAHQDTPWQLQAHDFRF